MAARAWFSSPYCALRPIPSIILADVPTCLSFIWSAVTINLSHSVLRLRRADVKHYLLTRNSAADRAASPFGLYRASPGPDFDQDILDGFDDIRSEVADELKLRSFDISPQRPREILTGFGMISK